MKGKYYEKLTTRGGIDRNIMVSVRLAAINMHLAKKIPSAPVKNLIPNLPIPVKQVGKLIQTMLVNMMQLMGNAVIFAKVMITPLFPKVTLQMVPLVWIATERANIKSRLIHLYRNKSNRR